MLTLGWAAVEWGIGVPLNELGDDAKQGRLLGEGGAGVLRKLAVQAAQLLGQRHSVEDARLKKGTSRGVSATSAAICCRVVTSK